MKVLLIGLGKMGQFHLQNLLKIKNVSKIYAFDIMTENFKIKDEKIIYINDLQDLPKLSDGITIDAIDLVDIAAPTKFHKSYLEIFIRNNKNIFVEKPMVSSLEELNEIKELINKTGYNKNIGVGFIERFNVVSKEFKNYIEKLGEPKQVEIFRYNPGSDRVSDVDVTTDLMIHDIDLVNYFFDNKEIEVVGKNLENESSTVLLKVGNTNITLGANRITQQKIRQIKFYYEDQTIIGDLILGKIDVYHKPSTYLSHKGQDLDITYMLEEKVLPKTNQLNEELSEFIELINGKEKSRVSNIDSSEVNMKILNNLVS